MGNDQYKLHEDENSKKKPKSLQTKWRVSSFMSISQSKKRSSIVTEDQKKNISIIKENIKPKAKKKMTEFLNSQPSIQNHFEEEQSGQQDGLQINQDPLISVIKQINNGQYSRHIPQSQQELQKRNNVQEKENLNNQNIKNFSLPIQEQINQKQKHRLNIRSKISEIREKRKGQSTEASKSLVHKALKVRSNMVNRKQPKMFETNTIDFTDQSFGITNENWNPNKPMFATVQNAFHPVNSSQKKQNCIQGLDMINLKSQKKNNQQKILKKLVIF